MADTRQNVTDLTAAAVLELARLGRVTDETYDALKAAVEPSEDDGQGDDADDGADEKGDDKTDDKTGASKATGARKASR